MNERRLLAVSAVSISRPSRADLEDETVGKGQGARNKRLYPMQRRAQTRGQLSLTRTGPVRGSDVVRVLRGVRGPLDERDAGSRAAHVGKEADKADDGLEIAQPEVSCGW